jgi:hypothetical protein
MIYIIIKFFKNIFGMDNDTDNKKEEVLLELIWEDD